MFYPVRLLVQKLYLASDEAFKKLLALLLRHDICGGFKVGKLGGHCSESFADSSRAGIVERHVRCAQSPMHRDLPLAPFRKSRLQSSQKFRIIN